MYTIYFMLYGWCGELLEYVLRLSPTTKRKCVKIQYGNLCVCNRKFTPGKLTQSHHFKSFCLSHVPIYVAILYIAYGHSTAQPISIAGALLLNDMWFSNFWKVLKHCNNKTPQISVSLFVLKCSFQIERPRLNLRY